mmetsp:Transcript_12229/g.14012  ORF Transcript_12229/g.14012 Transcript_12229/m.14012 type:complete len:86 (-) Transcript_12229:49-306(-)
MITKEVVKNTGANEIIVIGLADKKELSNELMKSTSIGNVLAQENREINKCDPVMRADLVFDKHTRKSQFMVEKFRLQANRVSKRG